MVVRTMIGTVRGYFEEHIMVRWFSCFVIGFILNDRRKIVADSKFPCQRQYPL